MFASILNKKGISLVEGCVALFLLSVGVLALITLQPTAWRLSGKSDYLGRASAILLAQLQAAEAQIMNAATTPSAGFTSNPLVYPGGQSTAKSGDVPFAVETTVEDPAGTGQPGIWRVTVRVHWTGTTMQAIQASLLVSPQDSSSP
jgi:Tfp pilus assembly protein PilV